MKTPSISSDSRTLVAFKRLMRPLVRLLIMRGIQLPTIIAALKQIYVDVASTDFRIDDRSPTDSRVSVLTGVHRRDVSSIRRDGKPGSKPSAMSLPATVIGRWLGDPDYAGSDGEPNPLPWSGKEGRPSFENLVRSSSKDIHPRTILDELIDQDLVDWDEAQDTVTLTTKAFVPVFDDDAMMDFFEMNLHDHIAAATSNVIGNEERGTFLERAVYYNRLSKKSVDDLEALAREQAERTLGKLNVEALRHQKDDKKQDHPSQRFRFGVFFYCEADDPPNQDD